MKKYMASLILAILAIYFDKDFKVIYASFFVKIVAIAAGTYFGYIGWQVGRRVRNVLLPDFVIADGAASLAKAQAFWAFGPQVIGWFIGTLLGISIVFSVLGASPEQIETRRADQIASAVAPELDQFKAANANQIAQIRARIEQQNADNAAPPFRLTADERNQAIEFETLALLDISHTDDKLAEKVYAYRGVVSDYLRRHRLTRDERNMWFKADGVHTI